MIELVFQNLTSDKKYTSKFFEKILVASVKELNLGKKSIEISVSLVGESKIKELNKRYRNKNKVTDVLSFPMSEKLPRKLHTTYYKLHATDFGDLFICLSFAKKEAKGENVSIDRKLAQLTVHGFLHLAGYDHERSTEDAKKMFSLENKILNKVSI